MKRICLVALLALAFLGPSQLGYGAGFLIYEHGAAAMAMGGAFIAVANDPSAVFHNPAGIAFLKGTHISVGTTLIRPKSTLDLENWPPAYGPSHWEQSSQTFYPSNVYITHSVGQKFTLGFGFFTPFGLGAKWPEENPLKYLGYEDDMKTFYLNPTVAYQVSDKFSVGVGISYIYSTVKFKLIERKDFGPYGSYDIPASLEGSGHSWSYNFGLLYRDKKFSLGLNYRSYFDIDYSGDLSLDPSQVPAPLQGYVPTAATGTTTFRFPAIVGLGGAFNVTEKLLLSADVHFVLWSRFNRYVVEFSDEDRGLPLDPMVVEEKWKDFLTSPDFSPCIFRGGIQYMLTPSLALRGGVIYDQTPQPEETMDPLLPDANRLAFTTGIGYKFGHFVIDATYHYEKFSDRTCPNRGLAVGTYKTTAHLFGLSLGFVL